MGTYTNDKMEDIIASINAHIDQFTEKDSNNKVRAISQVPHILEYLKDNFSNVKVGYDYIDLFANSITMRRGYLKSNGAKKDSTLFNEIAILLSFSPFTVFPGAAGVLKQTPNVYFQAKGFEKAKANGLPEVIITKGMHWHNALLIYLDKQYKKSNANGVGLFTIFPTVTAIKEGQEFVNGKIETEFSLKELRSDPVDAVINKMFPKDSNKATEFIEQLQNRATTQIAATFDDQKKLVALFKKIALPEYLPGALTIALANLSKDTIKSFFETKSEERDKLLDFIAKGETSAKQIVQIIANEGVNAIKEYITDETKKEALKNTFLASLSSPPDIVAQMENNVPLLVEELKKELYKSYSKAPRAIIGYAVYYQLTNHAPETIFCSLGRLLDVGAGKFLTKYKNSKNPEYKEIRDNILNNIDEGMSYANGKDPLYAWEIIKQNYTGQAPIEDMLLKTAKIRFFSWAGTDMFAGMMLGKDIMINIEMAVDDVDKDNDFSDPERKKAIYKTTACPIPTQQKELQPK